MRSLTATDPPESHWRQRLLMALACVGIGVGLAVLLWNWNWLRPLVAHEASAALGRAVTLSRFNVVTGTNPVLVFDDVAIADPPGSDGNRSLLALRQLRIRLDLPALWHHRLHLLSVELDEPHLDLHTVTGGVPNWRFPQTGDGSAMPLSIDRLAIRDGTLHLHDPAVKADFDVDFRTQPAADGSEPQFVADAKGRYAGQPIRAHFVGGSVLSLRDASQPYPVDLTAVNGDTHVSLQGTLLQPLHLGGARLTLSLRGDSLRDLYPLTAIPLPATPAYHLEGRLDYAQHQIRFSDFSGVVGDSDLSGDIAVALDGPRPKVTGTLLSKQVVLADLAGFIGAAPGTGADASRQPTRTAAAGRILPDTPLNLPKLRGTDVDVTYTGQHIVSSQTPVDDLSAHLTLDDGVLRLDPLKFGIGHGSITARLTLDAAKTPVTSEADVDFRRINLHRLTRGTALAKATGIIGGRLDLDTRGTSVATMLGRGNGDLKLFMGGGDLSALLVDLAGLDFGNAMLSAMGIPQRTHLRCMIADLGLHDGVLKTRTLLADTDEANVIGSGSADFADETLDYQLRTHPKHFSIGSLPAPIDIGGTFKTPSVKPDPVVLGARGAAAVALGVVLTPLAALLPTIQLGLGENHDCASLLHKVQRVRASTAAPATASGKKP